MSKTEKKELPITKNEFGLILVIVAYALSAIEVSENSESKNPTVFWQNPSAILYILAIAYLVIMTMIILIGSLINLKESYKFKPERKKDGI